MSDSEDEQSEPEEEEEEEKPTPSKKESEAEIALKKRREAQKQPATHGLDDAAKELLQHNLEDRQRMEDEIQELRKRNERRKKEREVEEKRLAAERAAEDERRKSVEEEKRRKKDEEDEKKKKDRASKMAEFEKWKNPSKPNFVISKKAEDDDDEGEKAPTVTKKSKEQQEAEKKAILSQRIVDLKIDGLDLKKLQEKASELHKLIHRLEGEKYDYEQRFKAQQVDMMELAERARQANKVGRGGVKRMQVSSEDVDMIQARFSGTPAKIEMYSKYERQKDKRPYVERKVMYGGPQWALPPDRIKPKRIIKWSDDGLPMYGEATEAAESKE